MHKCGAKCQRPVVFGGKKFTHCRHGFPRTAGAFKLNSVEEAVQSRFQRKVKKLYQLDRSARETWSNDYTPAILLLWEANTDTQYIGEPSFALNGYITGYVRR